MPDYMDIAAIGAASSPVPGRALAPPSDKQSAGAESVASFRDLPDNEKREIQRLRQRDAEVRRHEQAHIAAGGQYVRGRAAYTYTRGPDGRQYATGGEVSLDVGESRSPEATIRKMQVSRRAALAPESPSPQDRRVAAEAARIESRARQELARSGDSREQEERPAGTGMTGAAPGIPLYARAIIQSMTDAPADTPARIDFRV